MSGPIEQLTAATEAKLRAALMTALDHARTQFDALTVTAVLDNLEPGEAEHTIQQLEIALGLSEGTFDPLEAALEPTASEGATGVLIAAFVAVAALAAASVRHKLDPTQSRLTDAATNDAATIIDRFQRDTAQALKEAANRALSTPGTSDSRARQLQRTIGLSSAQGATLDHMRTLLLNRLELQPQERDERARVAALDRQLASYRGVFSAPQTAMLRKAMTAGLTEAGADALLDRHATALRKHRVTATAAHAAHATSEGGKHAAWLIAQFFGAIPATSRRHWRTAGDERVRHSHAQVPGMNPGGVLLDQPFKTPLGDVFTPPLEIGCRCRAVLKVQP